MLGDPLYADTSALVKLIIDENESESLARYVSESDLQLTSSVIAEVELLRAVKRVERGRLDEAQQLLDEMILVPVSTDIKHRAVNIGPESLGSSDAIHLATAIEIQADLRGFVSYDNRLIDSARGAGIGATSLVG
ncbi:MAG: type II toxin-antitoxin system VapC family toxin [Solirubrobacterales bacterium]|nr:type II toxin-antitoxin system VapC family toxin [Solirubrobacterales bacterium]